MVICESPVIETQMFHYTKERVATEGQGKWTVVIIFHLSLRTTFPPFSLLLFVLGNGPVWAMWKGSHVMCVQFWFSQQWVLQREQRKGEWSLSNIGMYPILISSLLLSLVWLYPFAEGHSLALFQVGPLYMILLGLSNCSLPSSIWALGY